MDSNPMVSFILPVYNSSEYIVKVVDSILQQNYNPMEIILVDDHSTDNSLDIIRKLEKQHSGIIKMIAHNFNQGLAAARNSGIKEAQGDLLIFLDSDISIAADFLSQTIKYYRNDSINGIVGKTYPGDNIKYDKFQKYLYEARRGARHLQSLKQIPYHHFLYNMTSVRQSVVKETGFFDEKITTYGGEDTEYAFRMARKFPGSLYFSPDITGFHHHYRSLNETLDLYKKYGKKNVPYITGKHPEMKSIYFYRYIEGPLFKRVVGNILKSKVCRAVLKGAYYVTPAPLYFSLVKLLLASAMLSGIAAGD